LFGLLAFAIIALGPLLLDRYSMNVLVRSFLYGSIAVTVDILWGSTGILSFGQSAFFGIGAYACGLTFTYLDVTPIVALGALVAGVLAAGGVATLVAWLAFADRVTPLYISVITLVLSVAFVQVINSGGNVTGSSSGLTGFETFDISVRTWFWLAGAWLVGVTALGWILVRSDAGRLLVSIRDNEQRCKYFGISTGAVKTPLFAGSAIIAATAGYGYAAYTDVIAPGLGGFQFGTELVIWVALGGRGTLIGPALAAVSIDFVSAYLSGNLPFIWQLVVGSLFIVVIVLLPQGLGPALVAALGYLVRLRLGPPPASARLEVASPVADETASGGVAIEVGNLAQRYGSLRVLEDISFVGRRGELISLVGPNGAGKTTLIRCLSDGKERATGSIAIEQHQIGRMPPELCARLGLARKFQAPNVFDSLTVIESLRVARTRLERPSMWRRAGVVHLPEAALKVVAAAGLVDALATRVRHLSHGAKQALELAMVLATEPAVLLLDEPTAGLSKPERTLIGSILTDLVKHQNLCVLLIEHDLEFVREISSRVIVLHQGRIVMDGQVHEVVSSEVVRTIYTGERKVIGLAKVRANEPVST
jgi:branched-chain amino acid transport system permease protein